MEALKRKWNSRRGASILLAMLFLLVCIMAGLSILAAAASNAGKIKSNKEEQQKYLTLSSAVSLLADELESVEYVGAYTYTQAIAVQEIFVTDTETGEVSIYTIEHTIHTYIQTPGALKYRTDVPPVSGDDWKDKLAKVLPLNNDFDNLFAETIQVKYEGCGCKDVIDAMASNHTEHYIYKPLTVAPNTFASPCELEFDVGSSGYGGLSDDKVHVAFTLRKDGSILLAATLWEAVKNEDGSIKEWAETKYTMEALLRLDPKDSPETRFVLKNAQSNNETDPIRWKLEYVFKKEATVS